MDLKFLESNAALSEIIVKPLYFAMLVNIVAPAALLFFCYWLDGNRYMPNHVGDAANVLFYVFGAMAISEAGLALWLRSRAYGAPMIRRQETFVEDLTAALVTRSRPIFILIALISVYGYAYFFLTGRFYEAVFFVVFSFLVFQVVRPRYGMLRKIIRRQQELMEEGRYLTG